MSSPNHVIINNTTHSGFLEGYARLAMSTQADVASTNPEGVWRVGGILDWLSDPFEKDRKKRQAAEEALNAEIILTAFVRQRSGRNASEELRKLGRMPGVVFTASEDSNPIKVHLCAKEMARQRRLNGIPYLATRFYTLKIYPEPLDSTTLDPNAQPIEVVKVLPKVVSVDAVTDVVEDINFMRAPAGAKLKVKIPVMVIGGDISPGMKQGGWLNQISNTLSCTVKTEDVPRMFTVDVSLLDLGGKVYLKDLNIPKGVKVARCKDERLPVVMISGKAKRG